MTYCILIRCILNVTTKYITSTYPLPFINWIRRVSPQEAVVLLHDGLHALRVRQDFIPKLQLHQRRRHAIKGSGTRRQRGRSRNRTRDWTCKATQPFARWPRYLTNYRKWLSRKWLTLDRVSPSSLASLLIISWFWLFLSPTEPSFNLWKSKSKRLDAFSKKHFQRHQLTIVRKTWRHDAFGVGKLVNRSNISPVRQTCPKFSPQGF